MTKNKALKRVNGNYGATIEYAPNSYGEWEEQPEYKTQTAKLQELIRR